MELCSPSTVAKVWPFTPSCEIHLNLASATSEDVNESEGRARGWGGRTKKQGHKQNRVRELNEEVNAEDTTDDCRTPEVASHRAPPKRAMYATPTSSAYVARISAIDEEQRRAAKQLDLRARQAQAQAYVQIFTLRWWRQVGFSVHLVDGIRSLLADAQDDGEPNVLQIEVDNPSAFHPKDHPELVHMYHCDEQMFQYYDSKMRVWCLGTKGTAPRDIRKLGPDDLCYRACTVRSGEDMPGQKKRPAPDELLGPETPRRPQ